MPLQHSTGGGVNRLRFVKQSQQGPIFNKYIVGSGVGGLSRSAQAALRRRANNNARQQPCCRPTLGKYTVPKQKSCACRGCYMIWGQGVKKEWSGCYDLDHIYGGHIPESGPKTEYLLQNINNPSGQGLPATPMQGKQVCDGAARGLPAGQGFTVPNPNIPYVSPQWVEYKWCWN